MTANEMYKDYQSLLGMNATRASKIKMLELIVAQGTNNWRVVGVSPAALEQFAKQEYKQVAGAGIQRAHVHQRFETYGLLIDNEQKPDEFWEMIADRDRTILALRGELNTISFDQAIPIEDPGLFITSDQTVYFPAQQVGYRHSIIEREFLREFHAKYKI